MHQLLTNRAQSGIRDQIRHPFRKIKEKERLVSLPKALFRADWPSSHVRGQSPSKRSVWFCVSDKCKDVRREWDCGWFIGWGCAVCRQCTHLQICTRRSLEAKEEAESYSLVAGTPSTSIDLLETFVFRKTVFLPSFKKALCDRPPLESKCSQRKWKICCAQRKRAWQSMTCEEKRFSKSELSSEESDELFFSASQRFYISPLQWALGRHCIKMGTKDEKGEKIRLWRA